MVKNFKKHFRSIFSPFQANSSNFVFFHLLTKFLSGPRNSHYDSADILGPEIFNMRWFLAPEIFQKWWFLGPENFIMTLQISGPRNHHSGKISGPRNLHYDQENLYAEQFLQFQWFSFPSTFATCSAATLLSEYISLFPNLRPWSWLAFHWAMSACTNCTHSTGSDWCIFSRKYLVKKIVCVEF